MNTEALLQIRATLKRKRPKFTTEEATRHKRVKTSWRKPRGLQNKSKVQKEGHIKLVKVGYKSPVAIRHLTKEGKKIIRISNIFELENIKEGSTIIITKTSKKNKAKIVKKAIEKKIDIINVKTPQKYLEQIETEIRRRKDRKLQRKKEKEQKSKEENKEKPQEAKEKPEEINKEQTKKELDKLLTKKE